MSGQLIDVGGRKLKLSNLDKVLYPRTGTTKAQVVDYYARVAPTMLPHLRARPLSMKRFPDGVDGHAFFEKNCPSYRPKWVDTVRVGPSRTPGKAIRFCVLNELPALVWVANLAALELHTHLHRGGAPDQPTMITLDLDPGPPADLHHCARIALKLRAFLGELNLVACAKASGGKGLHIHIPLNSDTGYDRAKPFAQALAAAMEQRFSDQVTANMRKDLRQGKVFIDWSQNTRHKTTACAYTLRARDVPSVSMPMRWDEVEALSRRRGQPALDTSPPTVLDRIEQHGDLFQDVLTVKQTLPELEI